MDISGLQLWLVAATTLLALLGAVVNFFGGVTRSLRNGIAKDLELVQGLHGQARSDLLQSVVTRSFRLVGFVQFPLIRFIEWLAILFVMLMIAISISYSLKSYFSGVLYSPPLVSMIILYGFLLPIFRTILQIYDRAARRVEYLHSVAGVEEARRTAELLVLPLMAAPVVFSLLMIVSSAMVVDVGAFTETGSIFGRAFVGLFAFVAFFLNKKFYSKQLIFKYLKMYSRR